MNNSENEPDYELFKNWFQQNGGKINKLQFPTKFPPTNYIGLSASQNIKPNEVLMSIPKKLIISVSMIRQSELGQILEKYPKINEPDEQSADFNIITLYIIWQRSLGKDSFFYPYLQCINLAQTIMDWQKEDIEKFRDPYITVDLAQQLRTNFSPFFLECVKITQNHPQIFKTKLDFKHFQECEAIVMTRCFGWGLPETMIIPYADFLNHSSSGVHTYSFSMLLENKEHEHYIKKRKQLNLQLLGINNKKQLPISYVRNAREQYVHKNKAILEKNNIQYNSEIRLSTQLTKQLMTQIQNQKLRNNFDSQVLLSSDSQDNDSEEESTISLQEKYLQSHIYKMVSTQIQQKFSQPKPTIHRQFQEGVNFQWWHQNDEHNYFIIANEKYIKKGQQIYNCYGKRSNRFLLIYYGFTFQNNKYDSVPFRLWDEEVEEETGQLLFVRRLLQKDWVQKISLGSHRYEFKNLSPQFRMKKQSINYEFMAFLRLKIIKKNPKLTEMFKKKEINAHEIKILDLEQEMLRQYQRIVKMLISKYDPYTKRQKLSKKSHDYFAAVLLKSNEEILDSQSKSIYIVRKVVQSLQKQVSHSKVVELYRQEFIKEQQSYQSKIKNRLKIIDYFRMLSKFAKMKK